MEFFTLNPARPIKLTVRQDRIRDLKRGYPWVFPHSLITLPAARPGSFAVLKDRDNKIFASGMYDPACPVAFRVCALESELTPLLIAQRIERAVRLRKDVVLNAETTCARLINGEGDGLPGLICDLYDDTVVVQLDGAGPTSFWNIESIAKKVCEVARIKNAYLEPRSGSTDKARVLIGTPPTETTRVIEHGALFDADLVHGQKSGFFFDQRENRQLIRSLAKDRNVLNLFGYTGGFSIAAGLGGARSVVTVDIAKPAVAAAEHNWRLNNLPIERHEAHAQDAFAYLEAAQKHNKQFDLIVVDPPSFAPSHAALEKGYHAYVSLFAHAARVVSSPGILALASCSSHVTSEGFVEIATEAVAKAKRRARILGVHGQPLDHPFPLVCRELQYLKFLLLEVW